MSKKEMHMRLATHMRVHLILILVLFLLLFANLIFYSQTRYKSMCFSVLVQRADCVEKHSPYSEECSDVFMQNAECYTASQRYMQYSKAFSYFLVFMYFLWIITFVIKLLRDKNKIL